MLRKNNDLALSPPRIHATLGISMLALAALAEKLHELKPELSTKEWIRKSITDGRNTYQLATKEAIRQFMRENFSEHN